MAFGLFVVGSEARTRYTAVEVEGVLAGFASRSSNSGDASFRPVARYTGPDGLTRYVQGSVGSSSPLGAAGDRVTVLVDRRDPGKAAIKSRLSFLGGGLIALMGLASCIVFFAVFRISALSLLGAVFVLGAAAWKLAGAWRKTPMSMQEWKDHKRRVLGPTVFSEEDKARIPWADLDALQTAHGKQRRTNRLAVPVLLLGGIGLLFLGAHLYRKTTQFLASALPARGVVVALEVNDTGEDTTWSPVVEFVHEGRTYRFKDSVGSNPASYRRGDPAPVLYDPSRPSDARIDRGPWNKTVPLLLAGFGALLCLAGLAVLRSRP